MYAENDIVVAIPAYNAGRKLGEVLSEVFRFVNATQVLVVNDGSTDGCEDAVRDTRATLINHQRNLGKGAALKTAFTYFLENRSAAALISMDADGQHLPSELPKFLAAYRDRPSDLIIGARGFRWPEMPLHRILSNRVTSWLLTQKLGQVIRDSQSGFRLYSRHLIASIELTTSGYETESEILIKACRSGLRLTFIPISTVYGGEPSHIRGVREIWRFARMYLQN